MGNTYHITLESTTRFLLPISSAIYHGRVLEHVHGSVVGYLVDVCYISSRIQVEFSQI